MPADAHDKTTHELPAELREQLNDFQRHLWRIKVAEAAFAGLFGLLISFLLVFLLDRLVATPPIVRLFILLLGTSLCAVFAPLWIRRWVFGHRKEDQLARLIARKFPKLGDRLLGVIELQDQEEGREALSPELRAAAMAHVARQASKRDMAEALPNSRHRRLAVGVVTTASLVVLGFYLAPKAGLNSLKRWLLPFSQTDRYTFTQLDFSEIPNPYTVPYGEDFSIQVPLAPKTDQSPLLARARYSGQDWIETPLKNKAYQFDFRGQQVPGILTISAGDATHRLKVEPEYRPELTDLQARIILPTYLQLEEQRVDIRAGILTALKDSQISVTGTFTRDLASAQATITGYRAETVAAPTHLKMTLQGPRLTTQAFTTDYDRAEIPITWTDVKGLAGATRFLLRVQYAEDQKPNAYIQGIQRQLYILEEETIEFEALGEDDFGLQELGLSWQGEFLGPSASTPAQGEMILKRGGPSVRQLSEKAIFSPRTHGISPQKLLLRAYTQDYKPNRERSLSDPLVIYILSPEDHAQMLKNRFDRVIRELEDAARREQTELDANKRLGQKTGEELQQDAQQKKLAEQATKENENTRKMDELAQRMEKLFQDAARNKDISKETMQKLADTMRNLNDLAQKDMPQVENKLNDAQSKKNTDKKTRQDVKDAIAQQEKALKKMQDTIQQANEANQNFEASTFVNRLKRAAKNQDAIANAMLNAMTGGTNGGQQTESPLPGAAADEETLDPIFQRLLLTLENQQQQSNSDIRWIQEDLSHFFARTQKSEHRELLEDMRESQIDISLERLKKRLAANHSFLSVHISKKWAKQLREWADTLGGGNQAGGGGGGGGGGSQKSDQSDFEFMLRVMKMVQQEQDIRSRTRALEQLRRSHQLQHNPAN